MVRKFPAPRARQLTRFLVFSSISLFAFSLLCFAPSPSQAGERVFKITNAAVKEHNLAQGGQKFADLVNQRAKGRLRIEGVFGGALGGERDITEGVQQGSIEMGVITTAILAAFEPMMGLFDMPFIMRDYDHAHKVQDGPVGAEAARRLLERKEIRTLAYYDQGFRYVVTINKPVRRMEDLKGLKLRSPEAPTYFRTLQLLGANPTPIPWPETYTALQTRVVDGFENSPNTIYTARLWEVSKYITKTNHIYSGAILCINEKVWQSLSPDLRKIFLEAAEEAKRWERQMATTQEAMYLKEVQKKGMVVFDIDQKPLRAAVEPFYKEYAAKVGGFDWIQRIRDTR